MAVQAMYVAMPPDAAEALRELAHREYRRPNDQVTVLVVSALRDLGLLPSEQNTPRMLVTAGGPDAA
jgi:hypothetical protein